jgi:hypothetical protein
VISSNTISGNRANDGSGGGIYCYSSASVVSNSTITGNNATFGAGMCCYTCSPAISNCTLAGNTATADGAGGGICCYSSSPTVVNCTFIANSAPSGSALDNEASSNPSLTNCILWGNAGPVIANDLSAPTLTYCDVEGGWSGTGNISSNPGLVRSPGAGADGLWGTPDDDYGDLRLLAGSPCIDAGNNAAAVAAGIHADLDGHRRFFSDPATPDCQWAPGTCGTAPIVDMGPYEYIAGDCDRDGDIDLADLAALQACVSGPALAYAGDCAKADLDRDGDVDQSDFGIFQRCYSGAGKPADPNSAN